MENNWSPPSFKWTVRRISLNVIARWIRGSVSLGRPHAQWHFSQVFWSVPDTPDLCPSGVSNTSWKEWEKIGDGNEASQKWAAEEKTAESSKAPRPSVWVRCEWGSPTLGMIKSQEFKCISLGSDRQETLYSPTSTPPSSSSSSPKGNWAFRDFRFYIEMFLKAGEGSWGGGREVQASSVPLAVDTSVFTSASSLVLPWWSLLPTAEPKGLLSWALLLQNKGM